MASGSCLAPNKQLVSHIMASGSCLTPNEQLVSDIMASKIYIFDKMMIVMSVYY